MVFRIEHDVAKVPTGGLLGAYALTQFAGTRLQNLHGNAVLRLESLGDCLGGGRTYQRCVENQAPLGLRGGDDLVPIRDLRG